MRLFAFVPTLRRAALLAFAVILVNTSAVSAQELRVVGEAVRIAGDESTAFMRPIWSPAGDLVAFTGSNYAGLYVTNPEGGAITQLSDEGSAGYGAEWSHDGTAILARVSAVDGVRRQNAVKLFEARTGEVHQLTEYRRSMRTLPRWMPDGANIYLFDRGNVEVLNAGETVSSKSGSPSDQIIFTMNGDIGSASRANPQPQIVTDSGDNNILRLAVSPDGLHMAYEVLGGNLIVATADGTTLYEIEGGEAARFSPDGEWITFMRTQDDGHSITGSDIYAARVSDGQEFRVTNTPDAQEMNPDWSPTGSSIVFDDRGSIYVIDVAVD